MADKPGELSKLVAVATDLALDARLRKQAIELIGRVGNHDALLALLDLAAKQQLTRGEREVALKHAREIIRMER